MGDLKELLLIIIACSCITMMLNRVFKVEDEGLGIAAFVIFVLPITLWIVTP